jgi:cystathionine beta-lyase/cystathionine gamma-synthase
MQEKELDPRTTSVLGAYGKEEMLKWKSLAPPLLQSVAYPFESAEHAAWVFETEFDYEKYRGIQGYIYARENNPTLDVFERRIAQLESADAGISTSSGMAAVTLLAFALLEQGDEIVVSNATYTCSFELFSRTLPRFGVQVKVVKHPDDFSEWDAKATNRTKFFFLETPSNPILFVGDIRNISELAHVHGAKLIVDNTLATPVLQRPLEMGADLVIESVSKYISGNGTILGGLIAGEGEFIQKLRRVEYIQFGNAMAPFSAWLSILGLETLGMRMSTHSANAAKVADFLSDHEKVRIVNYPGLKNHPQHEIAEEQMEGFSGLLSFEVDGGQEKAFKMLDSLKLIPYVTHEGSSRTVAVHPASTIFHRLTDNELQEAGISKGLIRLSVGLEASDDLIADLDQALSKI